MKNEKCRNVLHLLCTMIKGFVLRIVKQAVEELLTPQFQALHAETEKLRGEMDKRLEKIEAELASHSRQLARLDQRLMDLKESLDVERRLARLEAHAGLGER